MLELRLASARGSELLRNRPTVATLALCLLLAAGTSDDVRAHGTAPGIGAPSALYLEIASRGQPVDLEGTLQVLHEDYADGSGIYHYFLERNAERFELHFKGEPTRHQTGAQIRVKGKRADHSIAVESGASDVSSLSSGTGTVLAAAALATSGSFGAQRTAVMLVNFSNNPVQPYTPATARNVVFTTTSTSTWRIPTARPR